jgi:hypothetical protein
MVDDRDSFTKRAVTNSTTLAGSVRSNLTLPDIEIVQAGLSVDFDRQIERTNVLPEKVQSDNPHKQKVH